jgi:hypothetical protein
MSDLARAENNPTPAKADYQSIKGAMPKDVMEAITLAKTFHASGMFTHLKSPAHAVPIILAGMEWGIGPFSAMQNISIIQGRPVTSAQLLGFFAKRSGYETRVLSHTTKGCKLEFFKGGKSIGESEFNEEDAKAAGLLGKDNWKNWPKNMYYARAMSNGVRWYCQDATMGVALYIEDEISEMPPQPWIEAPADSEEAMKSALANGLREKPIEAEFEEERVTLPPPNADDLDAQEQEALL